MINDVLDADTWIRAVAVLERARQRDLDPVEQLHKHGLLRTPEKDKEIRIEAMRFILTELTSWRPAEMLRVKFRPTHTATPTDMYTAIIAWIEQHIAYARDHDDSP